MSTKGVIGIQGLKTSGNELAFPAGTLTQADNCMMLSTGVLQPCRGLKQSTRIDNDPTDSQGNRARELWQWGQHLFISMLDQSSVYHLALWETWATAPVYHDLGSLEPSEPETLRMKFAALALSAYFTTSAGLYGVDAPANAPLPAGVQRPPDFLISDFDGGIGTRLSGNPAAAGSWLSTNNAVAYRAVIGRKDANGVVKTSEPNGRLVVLNPADLVIATGGVVLTSNVVTVTLAAGQTHDFRAGDVVGATSTDSSIGTGPYTLSAVTATTFTYAKTAANHTSSANVTYSSGFKSVQVTTPLSAEAKAGWFVQLFRTDESGGAGIDPGDECFQCYERLLSATDILNGFVIIADTTPSAFLGEPLPTNENTGDGIDAGANDKPPLLRDVCVWDSKLFGIQIVDHNRLVFRVLGCGAPAGLQNSDVIAVNARVFFVGDSTTTPRDIELKTWGLPSQNILSTCQNAAFVFNQLPGCSARFEYDGTSPTGELLVDEIGLGATGMNDAGGFVDAIYAATTRQSAFADPLALLLPVTSANTSRSGSTVTVRCAGHGFVQGQNVMLAYSHSVGVDSHFPPGIKVVSHVVDANNFQYTEGGTAATLSGSYYAYALTFKSDSGVQCVRFSKSGEPDAWPLPFSLGGLPDGAVPMRVKPTATGQALMVFLENGDIFRVSGAYPYVVRRFDGTATLEAADSLIEHNGQLGALTTQGVVTVSDAGVGVVGRDVEDDTRLLLDQFSATDNSPKDVFALSYESDRQYQLWIPDGSGDDAASSALVFESMDVGWVRFVQEFGCGIVWRGLDSAVFGDFDTNQLLLERKRVGANLYQSYAGEQATVTVSGNQVGVSKITLVSASGAGVGCWATIGGSGFLVTASDASSITIAGTVTVTNGETITIDQPQLVQFSFAMEAAGLPGIEKLFRELQLHFAHRLFSRLVVSFTNEKTDMPVTVTVTPDDYVAGTPITRLTTLRIDVPNDLRRSAMLKVQVTLAEAFSYFRLLGYSATSDSATEKTGK